LRDRKGGAGYDGGYRVPFIVWGPGRVRVGSKTDALISGVDVLPTLCALAGQPPPAGVELDGRDVSAVWLKGAPSPREEVLLFNNEDIIGVRTPRWKLVAASYYRSLILPLGPWGLELFDMKAQGEDYSLAQTYPEVLKEMQGRLKDAQARFAPLKRGMPPAIRKQLEALRAR
jgi:arylsulfatase A-like enzyme